MLKMARLVFCLSERFVIDADYIQLSRLRSMHATGKDVLATMKETECIVYGGMLKHELLPNQVLVFARDVGTFCKEA
jgi:hypothetical protein